MFVDSVQGIVAEQLLARGEQVQPWTLHDEMIAYCLGCFDCWTKSPGLCRIDDAGRAVAASIIGSDRVIYLTPITFGGYSSVLKKAIDRSICLIEPFFTRIDGEVHHQARYARYPSVLAIGVLPEARPAQEQIFRTLVDRHSLNLHAPEQRSVILYRNQGAPAVVAALQNVLARSERIAV